MSSLLIQILAIVVGAVILSFIGLGGSSYKLTVINSSSTSKKWKVTIVIGVLMLISGIVIFGNNYHLGGWENPYTGLGFSLGVFGVVTFYVGKLGVWWNK